MAVQHGAGLIAAATYFGIDAIDSTAKQGMVATHPARRPVVRRRAGRRSCDYCESDVLLLERLLPAMLPRIDLPRALLRGRFMKAAAAIEWNGMPIDTVTLELLRQPLDRNSGRTDRRDRSRLWRV